MTVEVMALTVAALAWMYPTRTIRAQVLSIRERPYMAVARANGLNIPSGCTFGLCGTCKIRKTAGEVHMVHNGGISDEDIADGYILACCSNPLGRIAVTV